MSSPPSRLLMSLHRRGMKSCFSPRRGEYRRSRGGGLPRGRALRVSIWRHSGEQEAPSHLAALGHLPLEGRKRGFSHPACSCLRRRGMKSCFSPRRGSTGEAGEGGFRAGAQIGEDPSDLAALGHLPLEGRKRCLLPPPTSLRSATSRGEEAFRPPPACGRGLGRPRLPRLGRRISLVGVVDPLAPRAFPLQSLAVLALQRRGGEQQQARQHQQ